MIDYITPSAIDIRITDGANAVGANGQISFDTSSNTLYIYDGVTVGGRYSIATEYVEPYRFQGTVSGYASGGNSPTLSNVIDKFSFSVDGNATDVGDLTITNQYVSGQSSSESGYISGGITPVPGGTPTLHNIIEKFPFSADSNASDVGDLTQARYASTGQSSTVSGYTSGGLSPSLNTIDKFSFSADGNATDVGDLTQARGFATGQSSTISGYVSGGDSGSTTNTVDKFPFASDTNATDVGDLTQARQDLAGQSSELNGYTSAGQAGAPFDRTIIDKFPFATDSNATDVGDLTQGRYGPVGQSSTASGYTSGGGNAAGGYVRVNTIDKFPFAADTNTTDVGDLTQARSLSAGQQV